jgi:hypothetical protein
MSRSSMQAQGMRTFIHVGDVLLLGPVQLHSDTAIWGASAMATTEELRDLKVAQLLLAVTTR